MQPLLAVLVAVVLLVLPGYAATRLLLPGSRLLALAAAPAVSAGTCYTVGELLSSAGVPVDQWLGLAVVGAGLLALAAVRRRRQPGGRLHSRGAVDRAALSALVAVGVGAAVWAVGLPSLTAVPPHYDGLNHGFFTARIAATGSLAPATVLVHDVVSGGQVVAYYPLALHELAAMVVGATGVHSATAFTMVSLVAVVLAGPVGMFLLCRRLFPTHALVAPTAALASAVLPALPYSTSWWGGYPMAAGLALTPGVVLLVLAAVEGRGWRALLVAALAVAGLAGVHTSEVPLAVVLVAALTCLPSLASGDRRRAASRAARLALVGAGCAVLLAPLAPQLAGGFTERQGVVAHPALLSAPQALDSLARLRVLATPLPAVVSVVVLAGLVGTVLARRALPWTVVWVGFAGLYLGLAMSSATPVTLLSAPWYSDLVRLAYVLVLLSVPYLAVALAAPVETLWRAAGRSPAGTTRPVLLATAVALTAVVAAAGFLSAVRSAGTVRGYYRHYSLVGVDTRDAFAYLAAHVEGGQRVMNQRQDGSQWMYSLDDVAPMLPLDTTDLSGPQWADYRYLLHHLASADHDGRVVDLLRKDDVHYVYVGTNTYPHEAPTLSVPTLQDSDVFREVFHRGPAYVFQVTPSVFRRQG